MLTFYPGQVGERSKEQRGSVDKEHAARALEAIDKAAVSAIKSLHCALSAAEIQAAPEEQKVRFRIHNHPPNSRNIASLTVVCLETGCSAEALAPLLPLSWRNVASDSCQRENMMPANSCLSAWDALKRLFPHLEDSVLEQ